MQQRIKNNNLQKKCVFAFTFQTQDRQKIATLTSFNYYKLHQERKALNKENKNIVRTV